MSYLRLPLACLLAVTATAAQAADEIGDVRLTVALVPPTKDAHVEYANQGSSFSETTGGASFGVRVQAGLAGELMPIGQSARLVGSVNLFYSQQSSGDEVSPGSRLVGSTGPVKLGAMGANVFAGLAFSFTAKTHLEIGPFFGFGKASITDSGIGTSGPNSRTTEKGTGDYLEYGATVAIYSVSETGGVVFGAGISYFGSRSKADLRFNLSDGSKLDEHVEIDQSGLMPYITIGLRF